VHWLQQVAEQVQQTLELLVKLVDLVAVAVMLAVVTAQQDKALKAVTDQAQAITLVAVAVRELLEATHLQVVMVVLVVMVQMPIQHGHRLHLLDQVAITQVVVVVEDQLATAQMV
jgi:hypothetical protein